MKLCLWLFVIDCKSGYVDNYYYTEYDDDDDGDDDDYNDNVGECDGGSGLNANSK